MVDELTVPYHWLVVCLFLVTGVVCSKGMSRWLMVFGLFLGIGLSFWLTYQLNYVRSHHVGIVKTHSKEYVGYVTKHPYKDTLTVLTTPQYPILNCPVLDSQPLCEQELVTIEKRHVLSVEFLD